MYCELFDQKLVNLSVTGNTQESVFEQVSTYLMNEGMVSSDYLQGIKGREKSFPTGLMTQYLNIALPHSEVAYVKKPFVFIARLEHEIPFYQMGDGQEMLVRHCFFLGIKDIKEQVGLLQAFMNLFMDEAFVASYQACQSEQDVYQLFYENI